jgi:hypothetical protein
LGDYLTTTTGPTSLNDFFTKNRELIDPYIGQFDKSTDAKNLQDKFKTVFKAKHPARKRNPGVGIDIKEAWTIARGQRQAKIQKTRVAAALVKERGEKAMALVKVNFKIYELRFFRKLTLHPLMISQLVPSLIAPSLISLSLTLLDLTPLNLTQLDLTQLNLTLLNLTLLNLTLLNLTLTAAKKSMGKKKPPF